MATSAMISEQEYLRTYYEHDCEWIEGQVRERAMPDEFHSALQTFFIAYFALAGKSLGLRVRAELRVHVAPQRYRIPDVTVLPLSAPLQAIPNTPPAICIEVLSPDDRKGELQEKIADYVAMGVEAIWIVDPRRRLLWTADAAGMHPVENFHVPGSELVITPGEMFAELDSLQAHSS
jgi:Uma2 family endonuclease